MMKTDDESLGQCFHREGKDRCFGLPPYVLGTDSEVIQVIQKRSKTIQALKNVHGFGDKKVDTFPKSVRYSVSGRIMENIIRSI